MEQHLKRPTLSGRGSQGLFASIVLLTGIKMMTSPTCADETFQENQDFAVDVEVTLRGLLAQEDTDQDMKITVKDQGLKVGHIVLYRIFVSNRN